MSEPRYPTRVSDPDETTRIPKEALDGLRNGDSAAPPASPAKEANGSHPAPANGATPSGAPSSPGVPAATPASRNGSSAADGGSAGANGFRPGEGGGSRPSVFGGSSPPAPAAPSTPGFPAGSGTSGSGYAGRSETGYTPSAYPSSYTPTSFSSIGQTTVTGPGGAPGGVATASRPAPGARPKGRGTTGRPARRARLLIRHIDPWSTLKFSFVLAVAMFFVWLVAIGVLYGVLDGMGVFEQINGLYSEVAGNGTDSLFTPSLVLGTAALVGAVNIVLFTALATIGAFVYNICADLVGGIEVTLAERD